MNGKTWKIKVFEMAYNYHNFACYVNLILKSSTFWRIWYFTSTFFFLKEHIFKIQFKNIECKSMFVKMFY